MVSIAESATAAAAPPPPAARLRFNLREASGGLGDLGTFLPIAVALAATCGLSLAGILFWAGLMSVATGVLFRQPIAVQPMKALAAVAIAGGLGADAVAAAGVLMGVAVLGLGVTGGAAWLARVIPVGVVRGLQVGVGLKLAWVGVEMAAAGDTAGSNASAGLLILVLLVGLLMLPTVPGRWRRPMRRVPVALLVVGAALGVAWWRSGVGLHPGLPVHWMAMDAEAWRVAAVQLLPAQLPLTLLNSVVAVCLLSADLYPGRGITPARMSVSVGAMNLIAVPLGGMPMCHGAGGLAAQHALGARTGGAMVIQGTLKVAAGVLLGASAGALLAAFPPVVLGALLVVAGARLAWQGRLVPWLRPTQMAAMLGVALAVVLGWTLVGVVGFTVLLWVLRRWAAA